MWVKIDFGIETCLCSGFDKYCFPHLPCFSPSFVSKNYTVAYSITSQHGGIKISVLLMSAIIYTCDFTSLLSKDNKYVYHNPQHGEMPTRDIELFVISASYNNNNYDAHLFTHISSQGLFCLLHADFGIEKCFHKNF